MARLTAAARRALPSSAFAEPAARKYPINDAAHARNALSRVAQHGTLAEKKIVRAKANRKLGKRGRGRAAGR